MSRLLFEVNDLILAASRLDRHPERGYLSVGVRAGKFQVQRVRPRKGKMAEVTPKSSWLTLQDLPEALKGEAGRR